MEISKTDQMLATARILLYDLAYNPSSGWKTLEHIKHLIINIDAHMKDQGIGVSAIDEHPLPKEAD